MRYHSVSSYVGFSRNSPCLSSWLSCCRLATDLLSLGEDLIHLRSHLLTPRRFQIPHRRLHIGVTEPLLHGAQIHTGPQTPRRERGTELVQPEIAVVEFRPLRARLQAIEKIQLRIASGGGEYKVARFVCFSLPRL